MLTLIHFVCIYLYTFKVAVEEYICKPPIAMDALNRAVTFQDIAALSCAITNKIEDGVIGPIMFSS